MLLGMLSHLGAVLCRDYEHGLGDHIWLSRTMIIQIKIFYLWIIFKHPRTIMSSGKSVHLGFVLCRDYENSLGDHMAIKGHDDPTSDLLSLNYIQTYPNSYVVGAVWFLTQSISALCYVETMESVMVIIWLSRTMMIQIGILILWILFKHPRTVMSSGKSVHLGFVLCRDYENSLGDHMAIKGHDDPTSDLLSLNYIQTYPNSYVVGAVWFLTQSISALCYVETMESVMVIIWLSRTMMIQIGILILWILFKHPRTVMSSGKSGHLGIVLCRDYENGLGDHMAIKGNNGPNSYLLSLNYI